MKNNRNFISVLLVLLFAILPGCNLMAEDVPPYYIEGYVECKDDSAVYKNAGLTFRFYNISDKNVKSFTIVFYLFDENGEIVGNDGDAIAFTIDFPMKKRQYVPLTVGIDPFLTEEVNENYFIENLYVSNIVYDDGTDWSDP